MRLILAAMALSSMPLHATSVRVEYDLTVVDESNVEQDWRLTYPIPSALRASFVLDTLSFDSAAVSFATGRSGGNCVESFGFSGVAATDLSIGNDSIALWNAGAGANARFRGDNATGLCPGLFFGSLSLTQADRSLSGSIDFPGLSVAQYDASADPFVDLLELAAPRPLFGSLSGEWGRLTVSGGNVRVSEIPEPGALALLVAGLLAMALLGVRPRTLRR